MPEWLRARLTGSTALYAPEDDGGGGHENQDEDDEDTGGGDPSEDDDLSDVDLDEDDRGGGEPPARASRGNRQFGELRSENRTLRQQIEEERTARVAAEARAQERQRIEGGAAERARVEAMEPWERQQYEQQQRDSRRDSEIAHLRFQTFDNGDRADFRAACVEIPAYGKLRDKVEAEFQRIVKSGQNPTPREVIAKYLIGEAAVNKLRSGKGKKIEREAGASQTRQTGRPGSARSGDTRSDTRALTDRQKRAKAVEGMKL